LAEAAAALDATMPIVLDYDFLVRDEEPRDHPEVRKVNEAAFDRPDEADLVDRLRKEGMILRSFVAERDHQIVGHILFTRMSIETERGPVPAVALAPIAVLPSYQRRGIGSQMVRHGLAGLRISGERMVLVLGDPDYYGRFGFAATTARHLSSPFPAHSFLALELSPGALAHIRGAVRYPAAFGL